MTQDADISIARLAVPHMDVGEHLDSILLRADPTYVADMNQTDKLPKKFRSDRGFALEILTTPGRQYGPLLIKGLGCAAVPLKFMEFLIHEPIDVVALYGSGVRVRVPQPARYAVHKLIIGQQRRGTAIKAAKDFWQAGALIEVLRSRDPDSLDDAIADAENRGRTWKTLVRDGLKLAEARLAQVT